MASVSAIFQNLNLKGDHKTDSMINHLPDAPPATFRKQDMAMQEKFKTSYTHFPSHTVLMHLGLSNRMG